MNLRCSRITCLVVIALLLVSSPSLMFPAEANAQGAWITKAPIPTAREEYAAAEVGGMLYYIAGFDGFEENLNEAYDPATDTWTRKASLPDDPRLESTAVSDGSFIYVIGGGFVEVVGNDLWRYDPSTDSWTSLAPMPTARITNYMAVHHDGRIYVMGGSVRIVGVLAPGTQLAVLEIYDISTNTWSTGAPMPEPRSDAASIEHEGKIYVFGGWDEHNVQRDTTFIYDIPSNTWTIGAPMPALRTNSAGGKCGDLLHVIGGVFFVPQLGFVFTTDNFGYDPLSDSWAVSPPIPFATAGAQGVSFGDRIFVVSGGFGASKPAGPRNQVFHCRSLGVDIDIKPGSDPNSINVKSTGTIPVSILSGPGFDAPSHVDGTSLTFGRTGDEPSLVFCNSSPEDVNGDGLLDLVCHFDTRKSGFQAGDTVGLLRGRLLDGTLIEGRDSVRAFFPGDVDRDLEVDIIDAAMLGYAYGSTPDSPRWNPNADFNENGTIDIIDAAILGYYYGQHA